MITKKSTIRGELRNWREVHGTDISYFTGELHGDNQRLKKDGEMHITGTVMTKLDRGDFWLVKTAGPSAYMLYKDKEYKP